jgi:AcrR family transcriptional regulator
LYTESSFEIYVRRAIGYPGDAGAERALARHHITKAWTAWDSGHTYWPSNEPVSLQLMGRPRSFDPDKALDRAMHLFWRKGYEGTSLAELTHAMRINAPSLYAAFGNKDALFGKVIDRYVQGPGSFIPKALEATTARNVVEQLFDGVVALQTAKNNPGGCLLVRGALAAGDKASRMRKAVMARLALAEGAIRARLERAKAEGDLPKDADPADLARYIMVVLDGVAVAGAGGASKKHLQGIAKVALRAWPS